MKNQWNNFIIIREEKSIRPIFFFEKICIEIASKIIKRENDTYQNIFFFSKNFERRNHLSGDYRFIRGETDNWTRRRRMGRTARKRRQ